MGWLAEKVRPCTVVVSTLDVLQWDLGKWRSCSDNGNGVKRPEVTGGYSLCPMSYFLTGISLYAQFVGLAYELHKQS